jgi:uncharacterized protein YcbK (DUF882 family)
MALNSRHFEVGEFACDDGVPYPTEWIDERLQKLCGVLDVIREAWGGPIAVVSGYRTPDYNERLRAKSSGVAKNSQHVQGRAADIAPSPRTRENVARLHRLIERLIEQGRVGDIGGIGPYPLWVHVDTRDKPADGHIARWTGAGFGSEVIA